jgi:enterobactin synthetase component D
MAFPAINRLIKFIKICSQSILKLPNHQAQNLLSNTSFIPTFTSPKSAVCKSSSSQLSYCICNHNWQHYNQNCYARYGIQQPKELAMATAKRHCEFIAGRYCASQAIKNLGQPPNSNSETQILIQPDRSPLWPKGIVGSISHSRNQAIAVVGNADSYLGLGIDCESLLTDAAAREIADLVLQPLERELLLNRHVELGFLVTLAFSAKESLFKALSSSVSNINSFHDFVIHNISDENLTLLPSKRLNGNWPTATAFSIDYIKQPESIITLAAITATNR